MGETMKEVPGHPLPPTPGRAGCAEQQGRAEGLNKRGWSRETSGVAVLEGPAASQTTRRGSLGRGHEVEGSPLLAGSLLYPCTAARLRTGSWHPSCARIP